MPILREEREFFPDDLFDLPTADAPWMVAHLRSRQEKSVARLLLNSREPFYLPHFKQTTRRSGRTFVSYPPLFPCYIFLRRSNDVHRTLRRTQAVVSVIDVADQTQLATELLQIRQLQESGGIITPGIELVRGDMVRITQGAFTGYTGIVTEERGALRLVVSVSILRKSVAVEFPRDILAPLKPGEGAPHRRCRM